MLLLQHFVTFVTVLTAGYLSHKAQGYNLSPKANIILKDPHLTTPMFKVESSYFGFTLCLRQSSILIGAPRAQSTLESQRGINETGAIYKCSLSSGNCLPYIFDFKGNINGTVNEYSYDAEMKDKQWLGASMDGGPKDTDKLVVCAPRLIANLRDDYLMNGLCYWTSDTLGDRPTNVWKIAPLREKRYQILKQINNKSYFLYIYGEQGISAHVTSDNKEILIGAPGILTWAGSVIRHHAKSNDGDIILSRRDTNRRRVVRQADIEYVSDVPNPLNWHQETDSYFGFSISSGYFDSTTPNKTYYLASAPQANTQSGEAYIFDIENEVSIKKLYIFHGDTFGEYYGYAVLAEDINGDGLPDVVITAPQYSGSGTIEQGAFYVYINKGRFTFELQKKIVSPSRQGRFGTTVTRLGDINHDGYNDIAVGAPFAGNGTVYIYLGGPKGLREQPSQKLTSVPTVKAWGPHMFGHGLSKGADFDNNGFNDLAIGAPNAEAVFVYRAYPVVKIIATINSLSREIKPDQNKFRVNVCYMISTTSAKLQYQDLALKVSLDPQVKRVTLVETNSGELAFNATATTQNQCRLMDATVRFSTADIFKPIELELHYDLINGVPNSEDFCDKCAAVDPAEAKLFTEKIAFSTGCKTDICIADLKVVSSGLSPTYILGSSRTLSVTYEISNSGETAYLPQINITSSNKMSFAKIPSTCNLHEHVLLCDLNAGRPFTLGSKTSITIIYDVSTIEGKSMTLTASVFSTGKELNPSNNVVNDVISLAEFTEIEAIGQPHTPHINLEKTFNTAQIVNNYEIKSNGPSRVQELEISFELPVAYKFYDSSVTLPIIDINNITLQAVYDRQILPVDLYQNNTLLLVNPTEISMSSTKTIIIKDGKQVVFDESKTVDLESITDRDILTAGIRRNRRDVTKAPSKTDYAKVGQRGPHELLSEELLGLLPINRTIVFSCINPDTTICARAVLKVYNFVPDKPVVVTFKYNVNLQEVNDILTDPWEFFVIVTKLNIVKIGDADGKSVQIKRKIEYNIISKHQLHVTPIWVYILAILGGILLLAAIVYGMYKAGFFRRKTKEEMDRLMQGQQQPAEDTLLSGRNE